MDKETLSMAFLSLQPKVEEAFSLPLNIPKLLECFKRTSAYNKAAREYNESKPSEMVSYSAGSREYTLFYDKHGGKAATAVIKEAIRKDPQFLAETVNGAENFGYHSFSGIAKILENQMFDAKYLA